MTSPQSFAHYTVTEKIGAGGMGEVFRATDSRLGRDVALKMLPDMMVDNPERLARFQREAQVLAALNHPGIAAVYGLESEGDRHALAMELVPGPELAERLRSGALSVEEGLPMALQLAEAIEAAHEKGIVHRDLKPANIKLTDEGRLKVLDFGLAKALVDDPAGTDMDPDLSPTLTANMTMANVILGTAAYMSPEQARGTEVDKRADIWAFGVVVVEMLGGRKLFGGETVSDTLASVLKSEIELDALPDDLPPAVIRLLRRCLQRDPRQRLRDIGDARLVLQDVLSGDLDETIEAGPVPSSPWPVRIAAGVALLAVAAAAFSFLSPTTEAPLPLRKFEIAMDPDDSSVSMAFAPRISPDGRFLAYISEGSLWVRDLATTVSRVLPGTAGAREPFWSPDGEWIGYGTVEAVMKIDRSGGHSMIIANVNGSQALGGAGNGVWNPDGSIFYTTGNTGLLRVSSQAGEVTMHHGTLEGEVDFHQVCRLPGDRGWVMVVHFKKDYGALSLLAPSGERKLLLHYPGDSLGDPVWSPSGHLVFTRELVASGIWAVPFSLDDLEISGEPFLVAAEGSRPSIAEDGTLVYTAGVHQSSVQMAWFDRQGNELGIIADLQTTRPFPALSPDERQVAVTANAEGGREIWVYDLTNGNERRLTFDGMRWGTVVWHPDGRHLLGYTEPAYMNYLVTIDGSEPRVDLGPGILSAISPDGGDLIYSRPELDRGFDFDLYARPLEAPYGEGRKLVSSSAIEWSPRLSPDGRYLLYTSNETGRDEVYVTTYPGLTGRWQVSRDGGTWGEWRSDGREIFYTTMDALYVVTVEDEQGLVLGRPQKLFDRPGIDWSSAWPDGFAVTGDGQRFVMLRSEAGDEEMQPVLTVVQNWYAEYARE